MTFRRRFPLSRKHRTLTRLFTTQTPVIWFNFDRLDFDDFGQGDLAKFREYFEIPAEIPDSNILRTLGKKEGLQQVFKGFREDFPDKVSEYEFHAWHSGRYNRVKVTRPTRVMKRI